MSEHASVQSAGPGLLLNRSPNTADGRKGATDTSAERQGPFARHLSEARDTPSRPEDSSPVNGERSANTRDKSAAEPQPEDRADRPVDVRQTEDSAGENAAKSPQVVSSTERPQDSENSPATSAVVSSDTSASEEALPDGQVVTLDHQETSVDQPSAVSMAVPDGVAEVPSEVGDTERTDTLMVASESVGKQAAGGLDAAPNPETVITHRPGAQADSDSGQSPRILDTNPLAPPVVTVLPPAVTAPIPVAMAQPTASVRGATVHPMLAREVSQRTTTSADLSLARPVVDISTAAESGVEVVATTPATLRAALQDAVVDSPGLSEEKASKALGVQIPVSGLRTSGVPTTVVDGQASGAALSPDAGATNLPTNMFHAVASGTLTAAPLSRMDTVASPQLAPNVVHLQMGHVDGALSENVRWVVDNNLRNVTVNVTPSGMGPVSINVVMESEQMNVSIVATQGATREALEAALPRLREQLVQQGNEQVRVDVSDGRSGQSGQSQQQEHSSEDERAHSGTQGVGSSAESGDEASIPAGHAMNCGLVDAYA